LKILITYHTLSGNTELLAKTIYEHVLNNHQVEIKGIDKVTSSSLNNYDLVFVGSPCHHSDLTRTVIEFLQGIPMNPDYKLAGFYCHSAYKRDDPHPDAEAMFDKWAAKGIETFKRISKEKNVNLLGVFNCMGSPSPDIQTFINTTIVTDENKWQIYKDQAVRHPTFEDLKAIQDFADKVINSVRELDSTLTT
jgi:flavodoxin